MSAFYNENVAYPAEWMRNLMIAEQIAPGVVDERSIADLRPEDIREHTQAHFFAGIGTWSHALRRAGWPDDRVVWTGSCPCQGFSVAGRSRGFTDERHLWPTWFNLIRKCRPPVILGEQVASPAALEWLDLVSSDLEGEGYFVGAADICAAGVGAPHIRQRIFWVAVADGDERLGRERVHVQPREPRDAVADTCGNGATVTLTPGTTNGFWHPAEWVPCSDGKSRPTKPGVRVLAHGSPTRVGAGGTVEAQPRAARLKGYGNGIVEPLAVEFIRSVMDIL